ncbi:hypothetical protein MTR67_012115, partial [Solanum verrucosum]
ITYASRQLNVHEKNCPTHDPEFVVVLFALKIWHHYLYGVHVIVFTNYKSLQYVFTEKDLNLKPRRWLELLKDYDISILYHPCKTNAVTDSTKMYHNLREFGWWSSRKRSIVEFVAKCPNHKQVKVEHQRPGGMAQNIDIPKWK